MLSNDNAPSPLKKDQLRKISLIRNKSTIPEFAIVGNKFLRT